MQPHREALREALAGLGFVEGRNLRTTWRSGAGIRHDDRNTARELVAAKVDAILVFSSGATLAVQSATKTIPIVFVQVSDPIADGLVGDYARPGGNTTGVSTHHRELMGKRFELVRTLAPSALRVALIAPWASDPSYIAAKPTIAETAKRLGLEVIEVTQTKLFAVEEARAEALVVYSVFGQRFTADNLVALALRLRIPSVFPDAESVARGGLASYGTDPLDDTRLGAEILARILNGAKPGDLPVVQNSRFVLALNRKTAHALGLALPQALLLRAERVFE